MKLEDYIKLTGKTVSESDETLVKNQIRRATRQLENLLGFTLNSKKAKTNFYNEVGKARNDLFWSYPNVDISKLLPADDVVNAYRLYRYNDLDKFFFTDPFTAVHNVKLVYIRNGDEFENGITYKTFTSDEVRAQLGRDGIGKFIEKEWLAYRTYAYDNVQLAVDADWVFSECLPEELKDLLIDMIDAKSDVKNNIKNESIEGHSYTKYDRNIPEAEPSNLAILKRYAGPYGSVFRNSVK